MTRAEALAELGKHFRSEDASPALPFSMSQAAATATILRMHELILEDLLKHLERRARRGK